MLMGAYPFSMSRVGTVLVLAALLAACSSPAPAPPAQESTRPTVTPSAAPATPEPTVPLALVVHHSRDEVRISSAALEEVRAGRVTDWAALDQPAGTMTLAVGSPRRRSIG